MKHARDQHESKTKPEGAITIKEFERQLGIIDKSLRSLPATAQVISPPSVPQHAPVWDADDVFLYVHTNGQQGQEQRGSCQSQTMLLHESRNGEQGTGSCPSDDAFSAAACSASAWAAVPQPFVRSWACTGMNGGCGVLWDSQPASGGDQHQGPDPPDQHPCPVLHSHHTKHSLCHVSALRSLHPQSHRACSVSATLNFWCCLDPMDHANPAAQ